LTSVLAFWVRASAPWPTLRGKLGVDRLDYRPYNVYINLEIKERK
jgi:hypothetical protein